MVSGVTARMTRRQCFVVARRNNAAADLLRAIAAEDRVHDVPLWQLRAGLPDLTLGEHILAAT